jgi:hypothetical protein
VTELLLPVGVVKSMQTRYENEILDKFLDQRRADARLPVWAAFGKSEEFSEAPRHFFGGVNLIPQRPFALPGPNLPCFEQHVGIFLLTARPRGPFDPTVALPISPSLPPSTPPQAILPCLSLESCLVARGGSRYLRNVELGPRANQPRNG